ncbi:MAG: hypothetical protein ABSB78_09460 [Bacteroidota bacterium]
MKSHIDKKTEQLLSAYIDNEATPEERRIVEEQIQHNPAWKRELLRMRRVQGIVAAKEPVGQSQYFWTKLSARIEDEQLHPKESFFPFQRKWLPVTLGAGIAALLIIIFTLVYQKESIVQYVDTQTSQIRDWYEQNMLSGKVSTLASMLSNDDVFNFAMTGSLPVDKANGKMLQFGDQPSHGHFVEAENATPQQAKMTTAALIKRLGLDRSQSIAIDSLLQTYRSRLENSMLVSQEADSQFMAINADVWAMNKVLMVDIAKTLSRPQRKNFAGMLVSANAPVKLNLEALDSPMTDTVIINFGKKGPSRQFVIITPDTLFVKNVTKQFSDSFAVRCEQVNNEVRRHYELLAKHSPERAADIIENLKRHQAFRDKVFNKRVDSSLRQYYADSRGLDGKMKKLDGEYQDFNAAVQQAERMLKSLPDSMTLRIEINRQLGVMPDRMTVVMNNIVMTQPLSAPHPSGNARMLKPHPVDSGMIWHIQMPDSIRMVMMPRQRGVVLAGDQSVQIGSFMKDGYRKAAEIKSIRSRQDLEKRLRQLEKELQEMRKQMEKLEEP